MKNELLKTECKYYDKVLQIDTRVISLFTEVETQIWMLKRHSELFSTAVNTIHNVNRAYHGTIGIELEVAELKDTFKKHWFYGKKLDMVNVEEELGDIIWFLEVLKDLSVFNINQLTTTVYNLIIGLGFDVDAVTEKVIEKLSKRYKTTGKFDNKDATVRDTKAELSHYKKGGKSK